MKNELRILSAESEVERTRAQLVETVGDFAEMLEPRRIINEMWDGAKAKSADLAGDAMDAIKTRPVATTGIVAALTMFLAREPIQRGIANIYDALTSPDEEEVEVPTPKAASRKRRSAARSKRNDPKED